MAAIIKEIKKICWIGLHEIKNGLVKEKYPKELQFPITYKCNFNCVMCGMRNLINKDHCKPNEIREILSNDLFCKVSSVGINGGEPFIRADLYECIEAITESLPRLERIYIISNGYLTDKIISSLFEIKQLVSKANIKLTVSFSVDGIGDMQDLMRGMTGAFSKVNNTLDIIQSDLSKYCDNLNIICTITKKNVFSLYQVEKWADERKINVSYNVATVNARIDNYDRYDDFSIFTDTHAKMMATEFFYKKYKETLDEKYYALYLFCLEQNRYSDCTYKFNEGVTITPDGMLCYCATHSDVIGDANRFSAKQLFFGNKKHQQEIRKRYCDHCSHYMYGLSFNGLIKLLRENNRYRRLNLYKRGKRKKWKCV